jgi:glycerol-3-phosphate dehydrogenase
MFLSTRRMTLLGSGTSSRIAGGCIRQSVPRRGPTVSLYRRGFFSGANTKGSSQRQQYDYFRRSAYTGRSQRLSAGAADIGLQWTATLSDPQEVTPSPNLCLPSRTRQLRRLQGYHDNPAKCADDDDHPPDYDILVIGGGATGSGVALDAATRGYRVACIERGDFASETSSRSTKLLWAGIKYMGTAFAHLLTLENYTERGIGPTLSHFWSEMKMVYHCHVERHYMVTVNKHLCTWIPLAVPFTSWYAVDEQGRFPLGHWLFAYFPVLAPMVMKFYDALSGFSCPSSYILTASRAQQSFPQLKLHYDSGKQLQYCSVFYEALHNDARTNLAIALTAAQRGAHVANYVEAIELLTDESSPVVVGARVRDRLTGDEWTIRAKKVVLAGGPFTDALREMEYEAGSKSEKDGSSFSPAVKGVSGTHIVLPGHYLPKNIGLLDFQTSDGRFMFILPWMGHTLIGTTDAPGPAQTLPQPPEDEIDWLLKEGQTYLKHDDTSMTWTRQDVLSAWRGWRPLAVDPHAPPSDHISRDHVISYNPKSQVFFIAGGKWTTWREMAYEIVDRVAAVLEDGGKIPPCHTREIVLWGGTTAGYSEDLTSQLLAAYPDMEQDVAEHLVSTYGGYVWEVCKVKAGRIGTKGTRQAWYQKRLVPGYPHVEAEVAYACQEYACTIEDILSRRTRLAFLNQAAALAALPRVADLMAETLGWTPAVKKAQIKAATLYVQSFGGPEPHQLPPPE